jgi:hypothetical protein
MKKKTRKKLLRTISLAAVALQTIEFAVTMLAQQRKGKKKSNSNNNPVIKHPGKKKKKVSESA